MMQQQQKLRLIMVVCLVLSTFSSLYSQVIDSKQYNYVGNWYNWQGGRFINNLNLPKVQATTGRDTGAIRYALVDSSIYVWTGSQWRQMAGGAGSADSSVFATRYYTQQTFVPYTGATGSVNLGLWGLTTDRFVFNQTPTLAGGERIMRWNDTDGTLDVGMKGGNVTLQVGQEQHSRVRNNTGSTITNGQVVYISGSTGTNTTVALAKADASSTSQTTIGIATEDIPNGQSGFVTTFGKVRDINTIGLTEGSPVYLSSTVAGGLTSTAPTGDTYPIVVGICERTHAVNGVIFVHVDREFERKYVVDTTRNGIRSDLNGKQGALTLTTTGTSGASTLIGNTLNIPQYSGGGADSTYQTIEIGTAPTTVGVLVNETFSGGSIPSGWSKGSGLTTDYTGGKVTITGASALGAPTTGQNTTPYGAGLQYDTERFPYEKMRVEMDVVPTTKSADAYVGFAEANNGGATYTVHSSVIWDVSNAYSSGRSFVGLAENYTTKDSTQTAQFSANDSLTLFYEKNGWSVTTGFINRTTGKIYTNRYSTNPAGQGGRLNLIFLNGTYVVTRATVKINAVKNEVLFFGHSMASGSGASIEQLRYPNLVMRNAQNRYNVVGLPTVRAQYLYLNGVATSVFSRLTPTHVVIDLGHNDLFEPNSEFTPAQAKLYVDSVAQLAVAAGATVSIIAQPPLQTNDDILNDSLIALSARNGYTFVPVKQVLANGAVGYERYRYDAIHYNDSGYYKVSEIIAAKIGHVLLTKESADTSFVIKAHNIPYAKAATVVNLFGEQPDGSVVRVPNFFSPTNRIENKYSLESSIAQRNSRVHVDQALISDSALFIHNSTGLYINFNGGTATTAGTTGSNILVANTGVGGTGYPAFKNLIPGLRNIWFNAQSSKSNSSGSVSGNDNLLMKINIPNSTTFSGSKVTAIANNSFALTTATDDILIGYDAALGLTTGTFTQVYSSALYHDGPGVTPLPAALTGAIVMGTPYDFNGGSTIVNGEVLIAGRTRGNRVYTFGARGGFSGTKVTWWPGHQSGANLSALPLEIQGMAPTGNGTGSRIVLQTYISGSSGSTLSTTTNNEIDINVDSVQIDAIAKFNSQIQVKVTTGISAAANYTVVATDYYFELPDLAGQANRTITLPTNSGTGRTLIIKNKDSDATNSWSFAVAVKDNTDGDVTALTDDKVYHLVFNGTNWVITMIY